MLPNLAVLEKKCAALNLDYKPKDGKKLGKQHCVDALAAHFMPAGGLPYTPVTPMLCFAEWNLKAEELKKCHTSPSWAAQVKLNGFRLMLHFVKGVGVFAHTRTISVKTFRYEEVTDALLIKDYVPDFTVSLDCEAIINKPVDTTPYTTGKKGTVTKTSLHSAVAVAHLNNEGARKLQIEQDAPFIFHCFDVVNFSGQDITGMRLRDREVRRAAVAKKFASIPELAKFFEFPELVYEDRVAFADRIKKAGGEGVIWKNLESPYIASSSRPRTGWVKHKKRIEFDAFVSGFQLGDKDAGYADLVGSLEFSVNLKEGGTHMIGRPTNMPLEFRKAITVVVDGKPTLDPQWLNRVAEISGQDVSAREFRLSHCTLDRWRWQDGPDHKEAHECVVSREDLEQAAEWVD